MTTAAQPQRPSDPTRDAGNVTALFRSPPDAPGNPEPHHQVLRERDALHSLFDQAQGFLALLEGAEHRYIFSNAANNRLLGRADLVGRTVAEVFPGSIGQALVEILDGVYTTGEPFVGNATTIESGAGAPQRIVNFVYQPIRAGDDSAVTGILVEGHDVTAQHEAHAATQARNVELIHVSRVSAMGTMASTVAHELNQPLTAIANYLSAANRIAGQSELDPRLNACLASAHEASLRAGGILRMLRDMSLSAIDISPVFEVGEAIRQAVELARATPPGIIAQFDVPPGTIARVDRIQFQQVMLNLIRNAQEASGEGPCHLTIRVEADGPFLAITLADKGRGFSEEDLPNVFEALVTSKPRGMGVGLAVCRTIIETYGGRISADNGPDGGAVVRFTIPAG